MLNSDPCNKIFVQVVYALPQKQYLFEVELAQGASVKEAIIQSPILTLCPQIDINTCKIGIYSRIVKLTDEVKNGDRVEIYRSLIADPKELRRMRAKNAGTNQAQE